MCEFVLSVGSVTDSLFRFVPCYFQSHLICFFFSLCYDSFIFLISFSLQVECLHSKEEANHKKKKIIHAFYWRCCCGGFFIIECLNVEIVKLRTFPFESLGHFDDFAPGICLLFSSIFRTIVWNCNWVLACRLARASVFRYSHVEFYRYIEMKKKIVTQYNIVWNIKQEFSLCAF